MAAKGNGPLLTLLLLSASSCALGRNSGGCKAFVASHDAIRPGLSLQQVFDVGVADFLTKSGGTDAVGATLPENEPISAECRRHVFVVDHGSGSLTTAGGFGIRVFCNMNGPSDRDVTPAGVFQTKRDLLKGLDAYASWAKSMRFRVESPPLQIGGVYDSYTFSIDGSGSVATVSSIIKSSN